LREKNRKTNADYCKKYRDNQKKNAASDTIDRTTSIDMDTTDTTVIEQMNNVPNDRNATENNATNRHAGRENVIKTQYPGLIASELHRFRNDQRAFLSDNEVYALIRLFAMNVDQRVIIVSTDYTAMMLNDTAYDPLTVDLKEDRRTLTDMRVKMHYDDNAELSNEVKYVIIPIVLRAHFTVAILDSEDNTIHYFDSLDWNVDDRMKQILQHAINSLIEITPTVYVHSSNERLHNHQDDGYTCGIHVARNVESWLFNDKRLYTDNLNIVQERNRMIELLEKLTEPRIPEYQPPNYRNANLDETVNPLHQEANDGNPTVPDRRSKRFISEISGTEVEKPKRIRDHEPSTDNKRARIKYTAELTEKDVEAFELSPFDVKCTECGAIHFTQEKTRYKSLIAFTDCCAKGTITIDEMTYPDELKELFEGKSFFPLIRKYNTLPSFSSIHPSRPT
jgi:hypothetical protein